MADLTTLFESLITLHRSIDVAESEFKKMIYDNPSLREEYREWCDIEGYTERTGFVEFCHSFIDQEESIWTVLSNDDDDE